MLCWLRCPTPVQFWATAAHTHWINVLLKMTKNRQKKKKVIQLYNFHVNRNTQ